MPAVPVLLKNYTYKDFIPFLNGPVKVRLDSQVLKNIEESHKRFIRLLEKNEKIYGVNTGFGKLSQIHISKDDQRLLQLNLVRSHAAGLGKPLDSGLTRVVMFLKLLTFAKGVSGIRPDVAGKIIQFLNHDILPVIPRKGSVGASGDLAPLAHMALALIGEGDVRYQNRVITSQLVMKEVGMKPLNLQPKEGLSLINGTQVSTALAVKALIVAENLLKTADIAGALSVEASLSSRMVFKSSIHVLKKHKGQQQSARNVWKMLEKSEIVRSHKDCDLIQDPYSIRCIPQVHGACRDMMNFVSSIINNEINSVSDNPLILQSGKVYNSGHFHAEAVAQALDSLAIAMSEIGAISQRRIHYFMKGIGDRIPPFLAHNPGLESGSMLAHVTATALASENKTLAHPSSVDSIPTSGGQEDFVSMAPWAGRKVLRILENITHILAVEIFVAAKASLIFHKGLKPARGSRPVFNLLKRHIRFSRGDHPLHEDIQIVSNLITNNKIVKIVQKQIPLE